MTTTGYVIGILLLVICSFVMFVLGTRYGAKKVKEELDKVYEEHTLARQSHRLSNSYRDWRSEAKKHNNKNNTVNEYIIENLVDATDVLKTLIEYSDRFDTVSVADYYDLIKVQSSYKDNNWGWRNGSISNAKIISVRGGYSIEFPPMDRF